MELMSKERSEDKVLSLQRKLYRWSEEGTYRLNKVFNLLYNPYVLSHAWYRLREKKGSRTAGSDGVTVTTVEEEIGVEEWLSTIEEDLRTKSFCPDIIRRLWISKSPKPGFRPLGIPCLADRLVQLTLKLVLEPIFEPHFKGCSLGFRPGRGCFDAIATIHRYMNPNLGYYWVVEADLRSCFENIDHGILLERIKQTVPDKKILGLLKSYLRAGVLEQGEIHYPVSGSPQGGIISPLLANIYLDPLDEYYHQRYHSLSAYQRSELVRTGSPVLRYVRYADDFVILVKGTRAQAEQALANLRIFVRDVFHMELAEEKTGVHSLRVGFDFLGYNFRRGYSKRTHKISTILFPSSEAIIRFRRKVKELTSRSTTYQTFDDMLRAINRLIRGWGAYFRYGWVSRLFSKLDFYTARRVGGWLRKKHRNHTKKKYRVHKRKLRPGTWKWIYSKFFHPDITGCCRWTGKNVFLHSLGRVCPPRRLPYSTEKVTTPYTASVGYRQLSLARFSTGHGSVLTMEKSLQRH